MGLFRVRLTRADCPSVSCSTHLGETLRPFEGRYADTPTDPPTRPTRLSNREDDPSSSRRRWTVFYISTNVFSGRDDSPAKFETRVFGPARSRFRYPGRSDGQSPYICDLTVWTSYPRKDPPLPRAMGIVQRGLCRSRPSISLLYSCHWARRSVTGSCQETPSTESPCFRPGGVRASPSSEQFSITKMRELANRYARSSASIRSQTTCPDSEIPYRRPLLRSSETRSSTRECSRSS